MKQKGERTSITTVSLLNALLFAFACNQQPAQPTQPRNSVQFIGTWVYEGYENDLTIMKRSVSLDSSRYGFIIHRDGKFLERKNAGWCGTPPIQYANFAGEWRAQADSVLSIDVDFWGGRESYNMRIVALTERELRFKRE